MDEIGAGKDEKKRDSKNVLKIENQPSWRLERESRHPVVVSSSSQPGCDSCPRIVASWESCCCCCCCCCFQLGRRQAPD